MEVQKKYYQLPLLKIVRLNNIILINKALQIMYKLNKKFVYRKSF